MTACYRRKNENGSEKLRNGDQMRWIDGWMMDGEREMTDLQVSQPIGQERSLCKPMNYELRINNFLYLKSRNKIKLFKKAGKFLGQ